MSRCSLFCTSDWKSTEYDSSRSICGCYGVPVTQARLWVKCPFRHHPLYFVRTSLAWHKGIHLPSLFHGEHSERYSTHAGPGKRTLSHVMCITEFMKNSLKLDMKVTVSWHKVHRTVHTTDRGAIPQGTCTSTMPQKSKRRTRSHHTSILESHLVCHLQRLPLVRGRLKRSCIPFHKKKEDQNRTLVAGCYGHTTYPNSTPT